MNDRNNETVREVCAEIGEIRLKSKDGRYPTERIIDILTNTKDRILAAYERDMAAKDAEIEAALKTQNDYHAALLDICATDKTAEGLREIAADACNGRGGCALHERIARLEAALKPVMGLEMGKFGSTVGYGECFEAVREAQRIMKEATK